MIRVNTSKDHWIHIFKKCFKKSLKLKLQFVGSYFKKSRFILYCLWFATSYTKEEWTKTLGWNLFIKKKNYNVQDVSIIISQTQNG